MKQNNTNERLIYGSVSVGSGYSLMILLYVVFSLLGSTILNAVGVKEGVLFVAICALFSIFAMAIIVANYAYRRKENILTTCTLKKFNPIYLVVSLLLSVGMFLGLGFLNDLISRGVIAIGGNVTSIQMPMDSVWHLVIYVVVLAVLPAVVEEVFFRGFMLNGLGGMKTLGKVLTISFCFALFHGQITQFFYQFIFGVLLCLLTLYSGSTIPAIITHFINNFCIILFTYLGVNIDFYCWWLILIGAISLALLIGGLYLLNKRGKNKSNQDVCTSVEVDKSVAKKAHIDFWLPYGLFGGVICFALVLANMFM